MEQLNDNALFLAKFRKVLLHQLQVTNAALSESLGSGVARHQTSSERLPGSLSSSHDFCQFSQFTRDSNESQFDASFDESKGDDSDNEQFFEGMFERGIDFANFDMVDTSAFMHDKPASIVRSSQLDCGRAKSNQSTLCLTAPLASPSTFTNESSEKQLRKISGKKNCEMNTDWNFDTADFLNDKNADIFSLEDEDITKHVDNARVCVPLGNLLTEQYHDANTCHHSASGDSAANLGDILPGEEQDATATKIPTVTTKRPRNPSPRPALYKEQKNAPKSWPKTETKFDVIPLGKRRPSKRPSSPSPHSVEAQEQEHAPKLNSETKTILVPIPQKRMRPFKNTREKQRRNVMKDKYEELYNVCQSITSTTMSMPSLSKGKKSRRKLELLEDAVTLMEKMAQELSELRAHNKKIKSYHREHILNYICDREIVALQSCDVGKP